MFPSITNPILPEEDSPTELRCQRGMFLLFVVLLFITRAAALDFRYHDNTAMKEYLLHINTTSPEIAHLHSIGRSVRGQELWVMIVGLNPRQHTLGIPEFNYVANMHGNEVVGRELLLQLIDFLVEGYHSNSSSVKRLLSSTRIHLLPSMNPDGFDDADTQCLHNQGRYNHNGVDLNRNFPDVFSDHSRQPKQQREPEVEAVMSWLRSETFVLSANLHGGALVASYPYDSNQGRVLVGGASVTPDNDVFVHLAKVYASSHTSMHHGNSCVHSNKFADGITNGYEWYPLSGGLQDYSYLHAQCLDITLEVSCCKFPAEDQLQDFWTANRPPLIAFIQQIHLGVKGRVLGSSGPLQGALVVVSDRLDRCPFTTDHNGEYYRLLLPGNYTFMVSFPGYQVAQEMLSIPSNQNGFSALNHDFLMKPSSTAPAMIFPLCDHAHLQGGGATTSPTLFCILLLTLLLLDL
ncbi:unnamed protein product [Gadus morhua 'NCC']